MKKTLIYFKNGGAKRTPHSKLDVGRSMFDVHFLKATIELYEKPNVFTLNVALGFHPAKKGGIKSWEKK